MTDFSHETGAVDYRTPKVIWEPLHRLFNFTWDLMASDANHLFPNYFTDAPGRGLLENYKEAAGAHCFSNPAWGRGFSPTMNEILRTFRILASEHRALVVALIPSRDDVQWHHDDVVGWADILHIRGRITYDAPDGSGPVLDKNGKPSPAKFPTQVAIWEPGCRWRSGGSNVRSWDPYARA